MTISRGRIGLIFSAVQENHSPSTVLMRRSIFLSQSEHIDMLLQLMHITSFSDGLAMLILEE